MKKLNYSILFVLIFWMISCNSEKANKEMAALAPIAFEAYPKTEMRDSIDTYFGQEVKDPYRWLEDDNGENTKAWVKAQNKVTFFRLIVTAVIKAIFIPRNTRELHPIDYIF